MALRLQNSLTKRLEPFVPLDPAKRRVLLYSCGPTVYSYAHIGNFRSFLLADLLRRVLERRGFEVRHVMNITDVGHMTEDHLADAEGEDKLSKAARELGWDPFQVARHFENAFVEDAKLLRLKNYSDPEAQDRSLHPRATDHIPEMLALIQTLIERDVAYVDAEGQVYFEIAKFPEYGALSGKQLDELEAGARVEVRSGKRDARDFALWKVDKKHLMQWDPHSEQGWQPAEYARLRELVPGGIDVRVQRGFPGWHIECSAMVNACLGKLIDIHTGGEDNIFPHHECEIAQSCAALDVAMQGENGEMLRTFARYWLHGRYLLVDNRKMSKRDGTFYTVRNLLDPEDSGRPDLVPALKAAGFVDGSVPALVLRYALMSSPYGQPMNFSFDLLAQAQAAVSRLQSRYERLYETVNHGPVDLVTPGDDVMALATERCRRRFDEALDDNLDIVGALAAVQNYVGELNHLELTPEGAARAQSFIDGLDDVLGVIDRRVRSGVISKTTLEHWLEPDELRRRGVEHSDWRGHPERDALLSCLEKGLLPDSADLLALTKLDSGITTLFILARHAAKGRKQFEVADKLRHKLQSLSASLEDVPGGVRWRISN